MLQAKSLSSIFAITTSLLIINLPVVAEEQTSRPALYISPSGAPEEIEFDSAGSSTSLTRQEIEESPALMIPEILSRSGSVFMQSTTPGQATPFVRGLTGSAVLATVDGMRVNHALYRNSPNPDLALIDPNGIESIRVVYGPSSVRYGSDALGGVIQIESRKPELGSESVKARALARMNSADLLRMAHSSVEVANSSSGIVVGATASETGSRKAGGSTRRLPHSDYSSHGAFTTIVIEPLANHRTTLAAQYTRQPESPRFDELVAGYGQELPNSSLFQFEPLERLTTHINHEIANLAPGALDKLTFDAGLQRWRDDRRNIDFDSTEESREHNRSDLLQGRIEATAELSESNSLLYGIDGTHDIVSSSRKATELTTGEQEIKTPRFPDDSYRSTAAAYTLLNSQLSDSLTFLGGARYSWVALKLTGEEDLSSYSTLEDFSWSSGLSWEFIEDLSLKSSLSKGFRAPNVFDAGTLGNRPGNRYNIPNSGLKPEEFYTVDLGLELAKEAARFEVSTFASLYDNKIDSLLTGEEREDGRLVVQSQNIAEAQIYGVQTSGSYPVIPELLKLNGNLTWTWGSEERDISTTPLDKVPPLYGLVEFAWQAADTISFGPYLQFALKQTRLSDRDKVDPRIDPNGTDGWCNVGLLLDWEISKHYSLQLMFDNVADQNYREHGSGIDAAGRNFGVTLVAEL